MKTLLIILFLLVPVHSIDMKAEIIPYASNFPAGYKKTDRVIVYSEYQKYVCPSGRYSENEEAKGDDYPEVDWYEWDCIACPEGTTGTNVEINQDVNDCDSCATGQDPRRTFEDTGHVLSCTWCPDAASVWDTTAQGCQRCALLGQYMYSRRSYGAERERRCVHCPIGYGMPDVAQIGTTDATCGGACAPGWYTPEFTTTPTSLLCEECAVGYYSTPPSIGCTRCDQHNYIVSGGRCNRCAHNTISNAKNPDNNECIWCNHGFYYENNDCRLCSNGMTSSNGEDCEFCQAGTQPQYVSFENALNNSILWDRYFAENGDRHKLHYDDSVFKNGPLRNVSIGCEVCPLGKFTTFMDVPEPRDFFVVESRLIKASEYLDTEMPTSEFRCYSCQEYLLFKNRDMLNIFIKSSAFTNLRFIPRTVPSHAEEYTNFMKELMFFASNFTRQEISDYSISDYRSFDDKNMEKRLNFISANCLSCTFEIVRREEGPRTEDVAADYFDFNVLKNGQYVAKSDKYDGNGAIVDMETFFEEYCDDCPANYIRVWSWINDKDHATNKAGIKSECTKCPGGLIRQKGEEECRCEDGYIRQQDCIKLFLQLLGLYDESDETEICVKLAAVPECLPGYYHRAVQDNCRVSTGLHFTCEPCVQESTSFLTSSFQGEAQSVVNEGDNIRANTPVLPRQIQFSRTKTEVYGGRPQVFRYCDRCDFGQFAVKKGNNEDVFCVQFPRGFFDPNVNGQDMGLGHAVAMDDIPAWESHERPSDAVILEILQSMIETLPPELLISCPHGSFAHVGQYETYERMSTEARFQGSCEKIDKTKNKTGFFSYGGTENCNWTITPFDSRTSTEITFEITKTLRVTNYDIKIYFCELLDCGDRDTSATVQTVSVSHMTEVTVSGSAKVILIEFEYQYFNGHADHTHFDATWEISYEYVKQIPTGAYASSDHAPCLQCPVNSYVHADSEGPYTMQSCLVCPAGQYLDQTTGCVSIETSKGQYDNFETGKDDIDDTEDLYCAPSLNKLYLASCESDFEITPAACKTKYGECHDKKRRLYLNTPKNFVRECEAHQIVSGGDPPCETCDAGQIRDTDDATQCVFCSCEPYNCEYVDDNECTEVPEGWSAKDDGTIEKCKLGTTSPRGFRDCSDCPRGNYGKLDDEIPKCISCAKFFDNERKLVDLIGCGQDCHKYMFYQDVQGQETCKHCKPRRDRPNDYKMQACSDIIDKTPIGNCPLIDETLINEDKTCFYCRQDEQFMKENDPPCGGCEQNYVSVNNVCIQCPAGKYKLQSNECTDCLSCPVGFYMQLDENGADLSEECSDVSNCVKCPTEKCSPDEVLVDCFNRAGTFNAAGYCVSRELTQPTAVCPRRKTLIHPDVESELAQFSDDTTSVSEFKSNFGLSGFTFEEVFTKDPDNADFQCRRICDGTSPFLYNNEEEGNKISYGVSDGGQCKGPFACNVMSCTMIADEDAFQTSYRIPHACPVEDPTGLHIDRQRIAMAQDCIRCDECGMRGGDAVPDWGRGCAKECTRLICNEHEIFDWTRDKQPLSDACTSCDLLQDERLCTWHQRRKVGFESRNVSGLIPTIHFSDCVPKDGRVRLNRARQNELVAHPSYGKCVECVRQAEQCQAHEYYAGCYQSFERLFSGEILPRCKECVGLEGSTLSKYNIPRPGSNDQMELMCQVGLCSPGFTGLEADGVVCSEPCEPLSCADGYFHMPCALPHGTRCFLRENFHEDDRVLLGETPAHLNLLEKQYSYPPQLFARFENLLLDTFRTDEQCVWNARISDNYMNPGGVSTNFLDTSCRGWVEEQADVQYPMLPLQNTVIVRGDGGGRRFFTNTQAWALADRMASIGTTSLKLDLTTKRHASLSVSIPKDDISWNSFDSISHFALALRLRATTRGAFVIRRHIIDFGAVFDIGNPEPQDSGSQSSCVQTTSHGVHVSTRRCKFELSYTGQIMASYKFVLIRPLTEAHLTDITTSTDSPEVLLARFSSLRKKYSEDETLQLDLQMPHVLPVVSLQPATNREHFMYLASETSIYSLRIVDASVSIMRIFPVTTPIQIQAVRFFVPLKYENYDRTESWTYLFIVLETMQGKQRHVLYESSTGSEIADIILSYRVRALCQPNTSIASQNFLAVVQQNNVFMLVLFNLNDQNQIQDHILDRDFKIDENALHDVHWVLASNTKGVVLVVPGKDELHARRWSWSAAHGALKRVSNNTYPKPTNVETLRFTSPSRVLFDNTDLMFSFNNDLFTLTSDNVLSEVQVDPRFKGKIFSVFFNSVVSFSKSSKLSSASIQQCYPGFRLNTHSNYQHLHSITSPSDAHCAQYCFERNHTGENFHAYLQLGNTECKLYTRSETASATALSSICALEQNVRSVINSILSQDRAVSVDLVGWNQNVSLYMNLTAPFELKTQTDASHTFEGNGYVNVHDSNSQVQLLVEGQPTDANYIVYTSTDNALHFLRSSQWYRPQWVPQETILQVPALFEGTRAPFQVEYKSTQQELFLLIINRTCDKHVAYHDGKSSRELPDCDVQSEVVSFVVRKGHTCKVQYGDVVEYLTFLLQGGGITLSSGTWILVAKALGINEFYDILNMDSTELLLLYGDDLKREIEPEWRHFSYSTPGSFLHNEDAIVFDFERAPDEAMDIIVDDLTITPLLSGVSQYSVPVLCAAGMVPTDPNSLSSTCEKSEVGFFARRSALVAEPCPKGTYSELAGQTRCTECVPGKYGGMLALTSSSSCIECPVGKFSYLAGAAECFTCGAGLFLNLTTSMCAFCTAGTFSGVSDTACQNCAPGTWSIGGTASCTHCAEGTYSTSAAATSRATCVECPVGKYGNGSGANSEDSCVDCPADTYQMQTGAVFRDCRPCAVTDAPATSPAGSSNSSACICGMGSFGVLGACQACPRHASSGHDAHTLDDCFCDAGFRKSTRRDPWTCVQCRPGSFSTTHATSCSACTHGKFSDEPGAAQCRFCPAGKSSVPGMKHCVTSLCDECPVGTYQPFVGESACLVCETGKFSYGLASNCTACEDETCSNSRVVIPCPPGSTGLGKGACLACEAGKYKAMPGSEPCTACPENTISPEGSTACEPPPPGEEEAEEEEEAVAADFNTTEVEILSDEVTLRLRIEPAFRLTVGQQVVVDWTATPTHPFALSTNPTTYAPPAASIVTEVIDTGARMTTITLLRVDTPLYYTCGEHANFQGVAVGFCATYVEVTSGESCEANGYSSFNESECDKAMQGFDSSVAKNPTDTCVDNGGNPNGPNMAAGCLVRTANQETANQEVSAYWNFCAARQNCGWAHADWKYNCACKPNNCTIWPPPTSCPLGQTLWGSTCINCTQGTYKNNTTTGPCTDCGLNANSNEGSDSIAKCFCNAGYDGEFGVVVQSYVEVEGKKGEGPYDEYASCETSGLEDFSEDDCKTVMQHLDNYIKVYDENSDYRLACDTKPKFCYRTASQVIFNTCVGSIGPKCGLGLNSVNLICICRPKQFSNACTPSESLQLASASRRLLQMTTSSLQRKLVVVVTMPSEADYTSLGLNPQRLEESVEGAFSPLQGSNEQDWQRLHVRVLLGTRGRSVFNGCRYRVHVGVIDSERRVAFEGRHVELGCALEILEHFADCFLEIPTAMANNNREVAVWAVAAGDTDKCEWPERFEVSLHPHASVYQCLREEFWSESLQKCVSCELEITEGLGLDASCGRGKHIKGCDVLAGSDPTCRDCEKPDAWDDTIYEWDVGATCTYKCKDSGRLYWRNGNECAACNTSLRCSNDAALGAGFKVLPCTAVQDAVCVPCELPSHGIYTANEEFVLHDEECKTACILGQYYRSTPESACLPCQTVPELANRLDTVRESGVFYRFVSCSRELDSSWEACEQSVAGGRLSGDGTGFDLHCPIVCNTGFHEQDGRCEACLPETDGSFFYTDALCTRQCNNTAGFFNNSEGHCVDCTATCADGQYRQTTTSPKCECRECRSHATSAHWEFVSPGRIVNDPSSCDEECSVGFFDDFGVCRPHSTPVCAPRQYFANGNRYHDATCLSCQDCQERFKVADCTATADTECIDCQPAQAPTGVRYRFANCTRRCRNGYVQRLSSLPDVECDDCAGFQCTAGTYTPPARQNCTHCEACSPPPRHAAFYGPACQWACPFGFFHQREDDACVPQVTAAQQDYEGFQLMRRSGGYGCEPLSCPYGTIPVPQLRACSACRACNQTAVETPPEESHNKTWLWRVGLDCQFECKRGWFRLRQGTAVACVNEVDYERILAQFTSTVSVNEQMSSGGDAYSWETRTASNNDSTQFSLMLVLVFVFASLVLSLTLMCT